MAHHFKYLRKGEITLENHIAELKSLLKDMDIPSFRKDDIDKVNLKWLAKNLAKRNMSHPNYVRAMQLVHTILEQKSYSH